MVLGPLYEFRCKQSLFCYGIGYIIIRHKESRKNQSITEWCMAAINIKYS